jgi:hypothetical protein
VVNNCALAGKAIVTNIAAPSSADRVLFNVYNFDKNMQKESNDKKVL